MRELGIYVHIPFCAKKCDYCDFISYSSVEEKAENYIKAVLDEIEWMSGEIEDDAIISSVYIGGGTPSYIPSSYIIEILDKIHNYFYGRIENPEITIEVNPGTVTKEKIKDYKEAGVNRISIGLQATQDRLLEQIGRIHTYEQFLDSYGIIVNSGFLNVNIDIMLGLPNQSLEELEETVEKVIHLRPAHISIYSLTLEENTKLYQQIKNGELKLPNEEIERIMYWRTKRNLEVNGYHHYEISNYAKPGKEAKHNLDCWDQKEYIGIGVAAHSYYNDIRYSNTNDLDTYIENIENKEYKRNQTIQELQDTISKMKEFMILGLRKIDGIEMKRFQEKFGKDVFEIFEQELEKLQEARLLVVDEETIKLTNRGLDFANVVWSEFV